MFSAPKVAMLRVQPSPACNLNCSYCYIPAKVRRQKSVMSMPVLETLLQRLVDEDLLEDQLAISWHGAEPLVVGLDWYEEASARIAAILGGRTEVSQVFQTNGVLLNDAWCDYLLRHDAQIGVSLDGSEAQSSARVNWAGRPAYRQAMRGIAALNGRDIPWALLAVVTHETMSDPQAFIDFVRMTGCSFLGFKVEETNVAHQSKLEGFGDVERTYARFARALWRAFPPDGPIRVREFDDYLSVRDTDHPVHVVPVTLMPFRNLTVAANGDFTIFSGELLFRDDDRFVFGNVMDGPMLDCLKSERFREMTAELLAGARRCAATCEHYADCGSFYISQKYAETGSFDADETLACRLEIKTLYRALDTLETAVAAE
jgi:uncharacterized protein